MSSTIFYKFRSQKNSSRIAFDGTGLTVFDLKKEIINTNKLAPATDFNLSLYNPDTNEEYTDDNQVIPRSSSVIARRYPASKYSKSNASRYIVGKPRITKNSNLNNPSSGMSGQGSTINAAANMITLSNDKNISEEDKIKAMFQNQDMAWQETQELMQNATPVFTRRNDASSADKNEAPPPGYICYRCGSKDHFIKNCPTNGDANFDGKRIKRTAGIPRSSLKTVDKLPTEEGGSYMLSDDGKFVIAVADKKAWETFQKKQNLFNNLNKESITDKSLVDPITNKLYQKPVKTPCCKKTYSLDSIESLLIENDFICPNCGEKEILLDQLVKDEETSKKIKNYLEKEAEKNGLKRSDLDAKDFENTLGLPDLKRIKVDNNINNNNGGVGNSTIELPSKPQLPVVPNGVSIMPPTFLPGFSAPIMPVSGAPFVMPPNMPAMMPPPVNGFPFTGINDNNK